LAIGLLSIPTAVQAAPIPPAPTQWVTDNAEFLSAPTLRSLNNRLRAYQQTTGHQIYVWIGKTTDGDSIEDWSARTFKAWGVGRKGYDDGIVMFIMRADRTARIEVGYGLEAQVPDAKASGLIYDEVPKILAGDRDGAVTDAVSQLLKILGGESPNAAIGATTQPPPTASPLQIGLGILSLLVLIGLAIRYPAFRYYLFWILTTMTRSGGGNGNSGASGGGGRSGGGGASGRW
jgi:uncharacterized protein